MDRLEDVRRRYAQTVASNAGVSAAHQNVIDAFATVPRENFLGPPPWRMFTRLGDIEIPGDPADLYQDALVSLKAEAHLNNGQPSLHMACLAAVDVKEGETVVHVGAGTGYYTAILATLVGPAGHVIGYEIDPDLATRARDNLVDYQNVEVRHQSGTGSALPSCDVVYVNAGATEPMREWTNALRPGGRLLFPLTPDLGAGEMLLVTRTVDGYAARFICGAVFTPCVGARDPATAERLAEAFARGGAGSVRSLRFDTLPDDTSWVAGSGWWLAKESREVGK